LSRLRDEFEPLRAQLLARHSCVSMMDALVEVCNEETHLLDAGLLQSSFILVACSSVARPTTLVPLASASVAPSTARGESVGLHCDHCGRNEHVEVFCYRKKKA
jgi:hypothetical protein